MYVLVVGGGKVGYYLTKHLVEQGHEVLLIEKDRAKARELQEDLGEGIVRQGDGCEAATLAEAGAERADVLCAVTGDDEDNLVTCQLGKQKFGSSRTIARINNPKNERIFARLGIDATVSSTNRILTVIEEQLPSHPLVHLANVSDDLEICEVEVSQDAEAAGKQLSQLNLPCQVAAILRDGRQIPAEPNTTLRPGDRVVTLMKQDAETSLHHLLVGEAL